MITLTAKIYALQSKGVIRYVGKTTKTLAVRLREHLSEAQGKRQSHKLRWLRSLSEPPTIVLLTYAPLDDGNAAEGGWIVMAEYYGCQLVNRNGCLCRGLRKPHDPRPPRPLGQPRLPISPETRELMAAAKRGKPRNRADIEKMVATKLRCRLEREALAGYQTKS